MVKVAMVDKNKCIGCSVCSSVAPDVFELKDLDGKFITVPKQGYDFPKEENNIMDALEGCPTGAISIKEELPLVSET